MRYLTNGLHGKASNNDHFWDYGDNTPSKLWSEENTWENTVPSKFPGPEGFFDYALQIFLISLLEEVY